MTLPAIKVTCLTCATTLDLAPSEVRLVKPPTGPAWYSYKCLTCGETSHRTATWTVMKLLATGGVTPEHVPAEVWEPHDGPALTLDDLLDLHTALDDERTNR